MKTNKWIAREIGATTTVPLPTLLPAKDALSLLQGENVRAATGYNDLSGIADRLTISFYNGPTRVGTPKHIRFAQKPHNDFVEPLTDYVRGSNVDNMRKYIEAFHNAHLRETWFVQQESFFQILQQHAAKGQYTLLEPIVQSTPDMATYAYIVKKPWLKGESEDCREFLFALVTVTPFEIRGLHIMNLPPWENNEISEQWWHETFETREPFETSVPDARSVWDNAFIRMMKSMYDSVTLEDEYRCQCDVYTYTAIIDAEIKTLCADIASEIASQISASESDVSADT